MINVDDRLIDEVLPNCGVDAFAVIMVITRYINKDKKTFVGIKKIREKTHLSRERAYKAIAKLIDGGYLERWQENEKGNFGKIYYRISTSYLKIFVSAEGFQLEEEKEPQYDNTSHGEPLNDLPCDGNAYYGKPDDGNPYHISITNKGSITKSRSISKSSLEEDLSKKGKNPKTPPKSTAKNPPKEKPLTQLGIVFFDNWYKSQTGNTFHFLAKDTKAIKSLLSMLDKKHKEALEKNNGKPYETDNQFIENVFAKFLNEYAKLKTYYSTNKTPCNMVSRFNEVYVDIKSNKKVSSATESESKQLQKVNDLLDIIEYKKPEIWEIAYQKKQTGVPLSEIIEYLQTNAA